MSVDDGSDGQVALRLSVLVVFMVVFIVAMRWIQKRRTDNSHVSTASHAASTTGATATFSSGVVPLH
jgi:cation transport regulator ChaB